MDWNERNRLMKQIDPEQVVEKAIFRAHSKSPSLFDKGNLRDLAGLLISPDALRSPQHLMTIVGRIILHFEKFSPFPKDAEIANLMSKFDKIKSNMKKMREQSTSPKYPRPRKNLRRRK